jgi:eukaryotic-like serine/threonine-protein kinase
MALLDELQAVLGDFYTFERELTGGGMARVFVAQETRLGRRVAVKVLSADIAETIKTERFTREIHLLARLQHPHIVPILSAGEAAGMPYYTMPMIVGESLRDRLAREGRVGLTEGIRVANEVADALAYAHREGVLHRDIKPDNILISGRHALVVDFGIAKAIDASKTKSIDASMPSSSVTLTYDGLALGSPMYMSPEQAFGDPAVDARSDVYSLAVVLFEMLAGRPPFSGATAALIVGKRFTEPPPLLNTIDPTIPAEIGDAVARAMALSPEDRFSSVSDFASALLSGLHRTRESLEHAPRSSKAPERSIAVLPFINSGADPDGEYFSDGMTEAIINAIAHLPGVRVAARTSSLSFKGKPVSVALVGERLNVAAVLEGSVRRAGGRVRITAQLVNVADGFQLWSERYDRSFDDIFAIQDDIARSIVEQLRVTLTGSSDRALVRRGTDNVEAYDLYLRGRHFSRRRGPDLAIAIDYFTRAIAADPDFAAPHAGLADCHTLTAAYGYESSVAAFDRARSAAYRALALDPYSAESHAAVGLFELWMGWDLEIARRELRRASDADPSWAMPVCWFGQLAVAQGRNADAIAAAKRARQLEPLSPVIAFVASTVLLMSGAVEDADDAARHAIELDPSFPSGHYAVGWVQHHSGRYEQAIAAYRRFGELTVRSPFALVALGGVLAQCGRADEARTILDELETRGADAWHLGQLCWKLGHEDQAFSLFDRAARERNALFFILARAPGLEGMTRDPRWFSVLRRAGLEQVASVFEVQHDERRRQ